VGSAVTRGQQRDEKGKFVGRTRAPAVLRDHATIIITMDRDTGVPEVDDEFATRAETFHMLYWALSDFELRQRNDE
jgi:hypothetical protein